MDERSYWVFELLIDLFDHIFHAFKPSQDCILTKLIIDAKETSHLSQKNPRIIKRHKRIKDAEAWNLISLKFMGTGIHYSETKLYSQSSMGQNSKSNTFCTSSKWLEVIVTKDSRQTPSIIIFSSLFSLR